MVSKQVKTEAKNNNTGEIKVNQTATGSNAGESTSGSADAIYVEVPKKYTTWWSDDDDDTDAETDIDWDTDDDDDIIML